MKQSERLAYLVEYLWQEANGDAPLDYPSDPHAQWRMFRGLVNVRPPEPISDAFLEVQDAYLQTLNQADPVSFASLDPVLHEDIYLWQGDITRLEVDGIVNAANSRLLGCFKPNHACIDNTIHTKAGVQLRLACEEIIQDQGKKEGVGKAKITSAYNLPSSYVIHTVGPQIQHYPVSKMNRDLLARCYQSCLKVADENNLNHIAFCCISTGVFGFPQDEAVKIAIDTVLTYKAETGSDIQVIFNVFSDKDYELYKEALTQYD
ncbi:protein-ADP-ribose hydrolase [Staphylococcus auricularis]|uniref:Protein-ADP-ribose hydrolase n=1 Tax=Staphylococcus auricularis TaxID=29379 RepID=A0ABX5IFS3_9STAP|nr:protein-ADP-ribose hydrolase [Staphylococcus auricularis]MCE5039211.1 protein-ADP-ribose hydrolase [Staphylococcus auricularis]PTH19030.1 protein-ADP-ribose hydrolase [Staphylococcus auricularis]PTH26347.1 protein-ADP-ribose hydrolase [Staphylococcus auricularis]